MHIQEFLKHTTIISVIKKKNPNNKHTQTLELHTVNYLLGFSEVLFILLRR